MSDIFMEADDALRQERMMKFWQENGMAIILFVVLTIVATGAISAYRAWDKSVREENTKVAMTTIENIDFPYSLEGADLGVRPNMEAIVHFVGAGQAVDLDDPEYSLSLYRSVPENAEGTFTEMADLLAARIDKPEAGQVTQDLERIMNDDKSPWQSLAHMDAALSYARAENYAAAREHLAAVLDRADLPPSLYERAAALDMMYSIQAGQKAAE